MLLNRACPKWVLQTGTYVPNPPETPVSLLMLGMSKAIEQLRGWQECISLWLVLCRVHGWLDSLNFLLCGHFCSLHHCLLFGKRKSVKSSSSISTLKRQLCTEGGHFDKMKQLNGSISCWIDGMLCILWSSVHAIVRFGPVMWLMKNRNCLDCDKYNIYMSWIYFFVHSVFIFWLLQYITILGLTFKIMLSIVSQTVHYITNYPVCVCVQMCVCGPLLMYTYVLQSLSYTDMHLPTLV